MTTAAEPGQVWVGKATSAATGRVIRIIRIEEERAFYDVLRLAAGRRGWNRRPWGISVGSLRQAYRLATADEREAALASAALRDPGPPAVHLMILDPDDPGYDEVFACCCGINWRMLAMDGAITAEPGFVNCPGRPGRAPAGGGHDEEAPLGLRPP